MTGASERRALELFEAACGLEAGAREELLDEACAGDDALRLRVERLLALDEADGDLFDDEAVDRARLELPAQLGATVFPLEDSELLPEKVGGFRILSRLGSGGMGIVYEAQQEAPRRRVALKVLRQGVGSPAVQRRFEVEAEILARLRHEGIAQVYETGTWDRGAGPTPYFAMELVEGENLTDYARRASLGVRERLELVASIADAVHHAHLAGVIHRDLKPDNVLVTSTGRPKVLDFGVARVQDGELLRTTMRTSDGQLLGTLAYMSPEQLAGNPAAITASSDLHALGTLAFELLADRLPVGDCGSLVELARRVTEEDPIRLGTLRPELKGDVELIVAKALEREPARRYRSASEFAADLRRFLADEPILARAPTASYQLAKFARRHRGLVAGLVSTAFVLVAGTIVALVLAAAKESARADAVTQQEAAETASAQALAEKREAERQRDDANAIAAFLEGLFEAGSPESLRGRELTARDLLLQGLEDIDQVQISEAGRRAGLRGALGRTFRNLSEYETAERLFLEALAIQETALGPGHGETLATFNDLGVLYRRMGRLDEAVELYERSLAGRIELFGEGHELVGQSLNNLAVALDLQGRTDESLGLLERAIAIQEQRLGAAHPDTILQKANLANQLVTLRPGEAYERLVALERLALAELGELDVTTLLVQYGLGAALQWLDRYEESAAALELLLPKQRQVLGARSVDVMSTCNMIGSNHYLVQDFAAAVQPFEEARELGLALLDPKSPIVLKVESRLLESLQRSGDPGRAAELQDEVLWKHREVYGDEAPETRGLIEVLEAIAADLAGD